MRSRIRAVVGAFVLVASGLLSACLKSTAPTDSLVRLNGTWSYTGVQSGPVQETLTGTLTISRESGASFQGRLYLERFNPQSGQTTVVEGQVSGSESAANVVDFDADLESSPRRHVGQIVADTITGTWIGSSPDGTMSSGTFRVERETR
jgi:hypothetical protein